MEKSGTIGSSGVGYDVKIDALLNVSVSASYTETAPGVTVSAVATAPMAAILDALVAKLASPVASEVEKLLVSAAQAYLAAQVAVKV